MATRVPNVQLHLLLAGFWVINTDNFLQISSTNRHIMQLVELIVTESLCNAGLADTTVTE